MLLDTIVKQYSLRILFCVLLSFLPLIFISAEAVEGVFSITDPQKLQTAVIALDGEWEFYWDRLIESQDTNSKQSDLFVKVPGFWKKEIQALTGVDSSVGTASFRLNISGLYPKKNYAILIRESPGTSCALYVNGSLSAKTGTVERNPMESIPQVKPLFVSFYSDTNGCVELVIQVSNWMHRKGGLWDSVLFGENKPVFQLLSISTGLSSLLFGAMLILMIFNVSLFLLNRKKRSALYFAFFTLSLTLRVCVAGFSLLTYRIPALPYHLQLLIEYCALWVSPASFILLTLALYPHIPYNKKLRDAVLCIDILLGLVTCFIPMHMISTMVPILQMVLIANIFYIIYLIILAVISHQPNIISFFVGMIIMALAACSDMLFTSVKGVLPFSFMPFFIVAFVVFQFLVMSNQQAVLYRERLTLTKELQKLNNAYFRFVPHEFLDLLNKKNMTEVELGDFVETEMTILYSQFNITGYDKLEITPEKNYTVFRLYLETISPVIASYNGFISKFISNGLIALFPNSTYDALCAASDMQKSIAKLNISQQNCDSLVLKAGIGLHYGKMILGTIGEKNRLDDTVISDTVNTVSRIEGVAEKEGYAILVSDEAVQKLDAVQKTQVRSIGSVKVKGRITSLLLYEYVFSSTDSNDEYDC